MFPCCLISKFGSFLIISYCTRKYVIYSCVCTHVDKKEKNTDWFAFNIGYKRNEWGIVDGLCGSWSGREVRCHSYNKATLSNHTNAQIGHQYKCLPFMKPNISLISSCHSISKVVRPHHIAFKPQIKTFKSDWHATVDIVFLFHDIQGSQELTK